jgi:uncharacterized protein
MPSALLQFDEVLRPLVRAANVQGRVSIAFWGPQTTKHLIESLGVPHTEIREVAAHDRICDLDSLVRDGDTVLVSGIVCASTSDEPAFLLDGHLGRLAADLRMLGLDCTYHRQPADTDLARISHDQGRTLLSRDRHLLMRRTVVRGCLVRSLEPDIQLVEICRRFDLLHWSKPFSRCIRCNGLLQRAEKESIFDRLLPLTRLYYQDFRVCPECSHLYWEGSHLAAMREKIRRLIDAVGQGHTKDGVGQ